VVRLAFNCFMYSLLYAFTWWQMKHYGLTAGALLWVGFTNGWIAACIGSGFLNGQDVLHGGDVSPDRATEARFLGGGDKAS
jgi:hypothetical protein